MSLLPPVQVWDHVRKLARSKKDGDQHSRLIFSKHRLGKVTWIHCHNPAFCYCYPNWNSIVKGEFGSAK